MNNRTLPTPENSNYSKRAAINTLKTILMMDEDHAQSVLMAMSFYHWVSPSTLYFGIVNYLPQIVNHHLRLLQSGDKIYAKDSEIGSHRLSHYIGLVGQCLEDQSRSDCLDTAGAFARIYEKGLFNLLEKPLGAILFGLQNMHEQVGLTDFNKAYTIIQKLSQDGVTQVMDFSWHCKERLMGELLYHEKPKSFYNPGYKYIPESVQLALVELCDFTPLRNANVALEKVLMLDTETRLQLFRKLITSNVKLVPYIATFLRIKAIHFKLAPADILNDFTSYRIRMLFDSVPVEKYEEDFIRVRSMLINDIPEDAQEYFISEALMKRIRDELPEIHCQASRDCFRTLIQPYNIHQYEIGLEALASNTSLPALDFRTTPTRYIANIPVPDATSTNIIFALSVAATVGVVLYCSKALYRNFCFWGNKHPNQRKLKKNGIDSTTKYQPVKQSRV